MTKKAYIAGPVSSVSHAEAKQRFGAKERELLRRGYQVVNPVDYVAVKNIKREMAGLPPLDDGQYRKPLMSYCVSLLAMCDEVHLLRNWQYSQGACIEQKVAELLGKEIVYPEGEMLDVRFKI